jgi:hypothetical protein
VLVLHHGTPGAALLLDSVVGATLTFRWIVNHLDDIIASLAFDSGRA